MDYRFETMRTKATSCFPNHTIDLSDCTWCDPWAIGLACLKAVEFKDFNDRNLILPKSAEVLSYLKRMHFDQIMRELGYESFLKPLAAIEMNERDNPGVQEIIWCKYRDEFDARLKGGIRRMLIGFGMSGDAEAMTTALIGEMGNNVYDHNEGQWPTNIGGAFILAQYYPKLRQAHVVVADPGIGFLGSLSPTNPEISNAVEAILLGLSGVTGRVNEDRGNGLLLIQEWAVNKFRGEFRVQSGDGLVVVSGVGKERESVHPVLGTLASFVVNYE